ncbi:DUF6471 domain-containing protein [Chelativorans salis]|uniref:DUF6471 domain-containing protein n=1 Tax=Chelativorans salis TaxID=2978478 RepID=UPI003CC6111F
MWSGRPDAKLAEKLAAMDNHELAPNLNNKTSRGAFHVPWWHVTPIAAGSPRKIV